jgi:alpha-ketoglutarate-dependent taurine dioxygenase
VLTKPVIFSIRNTEELLEKTALISRDLVNSKLVIIPNMNIGDNNRNDLMISVALNYGWKADLDIDNLCQFKYQEDHSFSVAQAEMLNSNSGTDVITAWHLEHPQLKYPPCGAIWYMDKKICLKEFGSTGFVDMELILDEVPSPYVDFLQGCEIVQMSFNSLSDNEDIDIFTSITEDGNRSYVHIAWPKTDFGIPSYLRPAIDVNPATNKKTLRVTPKGELYRGKFIGHDRLARYEGRRPTSSEDEYFNLISEWTFANVTQNPEFQYWHNWDEGDIILVDLFAMAHAVRGGFQPGERIMKGILAFPKIDNLPRQPEYPNQDV